MTGKRGEEGRPRQVWLNGEVLPAAQARISVFDRGFLLGDGVYETLLVHRGKVFRWEPHRARLEGSLSAARIGLSYSWEAVEKGIRGCLEANHLQESRVRVTVSRGESGPGLEVGSSAEPATVLITAHSYRSLPESCYSEGVEAIVATIRQTRSESLDPALKSISRIHLVLARLEAADRGAHEAILLDAEGHVAEATSSNVFFGGEKSLWTPPLEAGILAGVTRSTVLELACEAGFDVHEEAIRGERMASFEEIFLTNTSCGVLPVTRIEDRPIGTGRPGAMAIQLRQRLGELLEKECRE